MKHTLAIVVAFMLVASCASHDVQPTPTIQVNAAAESLLSLARADLSQRLSLSADDVTVVSVSARDFSDSSLGVPQPGQMYTQVITPGYVIVLAVRGKQYTYHGSGKRIVLAAAPTSALPLALSSTRRSQ